MIATAPHRPFRIQPTRWFASPDSLAAAGDALRERLRVLECARDPRASFCRAYAAHVPLVSRAVGDGVPHAAWIERIAVALAQRYLAALAGWDRGDMSTTPEAWRAAFAIARHPAISGSSALAASLAAHLAFDLPLVIARYGVDEPTSRASCDTLAAISWPGVPSSVARDAAARACDDAIALLAATGDAARSREFTRIEAGVLRMLRSLAAA